MNTLHPTRLPEKRDGRALGSARFGQRRRINDASRPRHNAPPLSVEPVSVSKRVSGRWFVYLLALKDGSAFELGFCCNPLDRLRELASRFHERFDLCSSLLLSVDSRDRACQLAGNLQHQLLQVSTAERDWLTSAASDQARWFGAAHLTEAQERLASMSDRGQPLLSLAQVVGSDLSRLQADTEIWAFGIAKRLNADIAYVPSASHLALARSLRDWLDAYRALRVPLFARQPEQGNFVWQIVRLYRPALAATI